MSFLATACVTLGLLLQPAAEPPKPGPGGPAEGVKPAAQPADKPADPALVIVVDADEAPDLKEWGDKAAEICKAQWPMLLRELKGEGFTAPAQVKIVFRKEMKVPAATGGAVISVNAAYVKDHKDDFGMMVHELVHVVQQYPGQRGLGWVTEGVADFVRFWKYEPQARQPRINTAKASYRDSYRTTAAFFGFLALKYDADIATKLNARMRKRGASEEMFKEIVGKPVDELWKEFIAAGAPSSPEAQKKWWETQKPAAKLTVTLDYSEAPDLKAWAEKAAGICEKQWPALVEELKSEGFTPPTACTIVMRKELDAPAVTSGTEISVSVKHVKNNRNDWGMVVHELVHVAQQYPGHQEDLTWLMEGIADYERFWKFEPRAPQPVIKVETASYRDSYRTSAAFVGFLVLKHDPAIVTKLNARMRTPAAGEAMFKDLLGKPVDELWKEFIDAGAPNSPETQKAWWDEEKKKEGEGKK